MTDCEFNKDGSISRKRLHSGNLPSIPRTEECYVCSAKFTRLNHLKRHLLTHTDNRKHECDNCHFQFTRRDLLTKHLRICGKPKAKPSKSRRRSCTPCAIAKCKCDLQQPCSSCIAKKRECTFSDPNSVTAIKVTTVISPKTDCAIIPSTSSDSILIPDDLLPSHLKSPVPGEQLTDRHILDFSSTPCFTVPSAIVVPNQTWLGGAAQPVDQFNPSCVQDIFLDWNIPPGCNPLDFSSTFSPVYASTETASLGVISDPTHILTSSTYLEPESTHKSAVQLKQYFDISLGVYSTFLPVLHSTWETEGKSPLLITFMQAAGAYQVKSPEAREFLRFAIEDMTPVLTREVSRTTTDIDYQAQLLAAHLFVVTFPVFQVPTKKLVPCPWLAVVGEAVEDMIHRGDLINDVATCQLFTAYPLTTTALHDRWVKWAEYESRKRLLWMLYCTDVMQVLYFGGRPAFHILYFPVPFPSEVSVWCADNATTWIDLLAADSQYGQFSERLVGSSASGRLHSLQREWNAPLPLNIWELTCLLAAITVELESCLYQRHKTEIATRYLFERLPGPTQITFFGEDVPTSTVRLMLRNWVNSFTNSTELIHEGWEKTGCAFQEIIHLWYLSHVFLGIYEKPTNEFKYDGTRTANVVKSWLSKNLPKGDNGSFRFMRDMGNVRFQNMDYEPYQEDR